MIITKRWFAWYPVFTQVDWKWAWMKTIHRRQVAKYGLVWWEYSLSPQEEKE